MVTALCAFAHARRGFPRFAGSLAHALATCTLPPLILVAHHNISPSLEKQLVLELERWMSLTERFEWLPTPACSPSERARARRRDAGWHAERALASEADGHVVVEVVPVSTTAGCP